ncbi:hypothetical protein MLD38_025821 [Melastoma candidum]|uniref:Uncharacterized protein n=1 Tax=Melastoma candidum TaxID=119954 RepID=A0ACB9NX22_9MYRT|nr:hypothetical protein MLD38_025821 [Melastoma candidum]
MDSSSSSSCSCCYLQVDVNGEQTFFVDKEIVCSFSGKLSQLFRMSSRDARSLKVIFNDFPGGPESFELVSRFCYNDGKVEISPSNTAFLHAAARYMEMRDPVSGGADNLVGQTRKALEEVKYWTWSDLIALLKQCQELNMVETLSGASFLGKCLDSVVRRVALSSEPSPSPSTSSSDSSGQRFSCDTKSTTTTTTESLKSSFSRITWWFDELLFVNPALLESLVHAMISQKFDHGLISKFLFYYHKSKSPSVTTNEKCEILDVMIDLLNDLEWGSISCKSLFGVLRTTLALDIDRCSRNKLEIMIGSQMDQANLDNLLMPSPSGMNHLYDVDLVLRLLNGFLKAQCDQGSFIQLQKVASLLDAYLAEVAPDPCLKPSKFLALAASLPDSARVSYDNMYHALDMYMEVHAGLSEEDKEKLNSALNYGKLSAEAYKDISLNPKFQTRQITRARNSPQAKFKTLLPLACSPCLLNQINSNRKNSKGDPQKHIMLYNSGVDLHSDNEKLRAQLRGMQSRVTEMEKVCRKMQNQMARMLKSRVGSHNRSLPRLCS